MIRFRFEKGSFPGMNLRWWGPTRREWAPILANDQKIFWQQESNPDTGRPWARLTPAYQEWKQQHYPGEPILRQTGRMQDNMQIKVRGNVFSVYGAPYGRYQQFGTSEMVARPWVGVPDNSLKQIVPISWKNILSRKSK